MRYNNIIGLFILLGLFSCNDTVKSKTDYRLDRAGNPEYKEIEYQYITGKDEQGNEIEIRNGLTREFYPSGQVKSEIDFVYGKVNGQLKTYFEDGKIAGISTWINGSRDGKSKYFYNHGIVYQEETYRNGKLEGEQKTYFDNGQLKTTIIYKNDFVWRVLVTDDSLGNKLDELTIDNGKGVLNAYYNNGQIQSQTDFVNGVPNGKSKFFFESGKEQGYITFVNGKKNGEVLFFHENGQIARTAIFKNDIIVGVEQKYNQRGGIISETFYKENLTTNDIELLSGGIFQAVSEAIDPLGLWQGIMNGPYKTYHDNGQLKTEQYYFDGLQDSIFREYFENGAIKTEIYFDRNYDSNRRYEKSFSKTGKTVKSLAFKPRGHEENDQEKELRKLLESKTKD